MSVRRLDDDGYDDGGGYVQSSLNASIGALAESLPGATRLSHVLAIGAKFKLEQQQQQRKMVNTDGYDRGAYARDYNLEHYTFNGTNVPAALPAYRNAMNLFGQMPQNPARQQAARNQIVILANAAQTVEDIDHLRKMDAYPALLEIANSVPNTNRGRWAKFMIQESLYHDKQDQATVANLAWQQLMLANQALGMAFNILNFPQLTPQEIYKMDEKVGENHVERMEERSRRQMDARAAKLKAERLYQGDGFLKSGDQSNNKWGWDGRASDRVWR